MIRIDAVWLSSAPLDMRAGTDTALARALAVFGCAQLLSDSHFPSDAEWLRYGLAQLL